MKRHRSSFFSTSLFQIGAERTWLAGYLLLALATISLLLIITGCDSGHSSNHTVPWETIFAGTWTESDGNLYTFIPDGTGSITWKEESLLSNKLHNVGIKWQVSEGNLFETITSTDTDKLPVGFVLSCKISHLGDGQIDLISNATGEHLKLRRANAGR